MLEIHDLNDNYILLLFMFYATCRRQSSDTYVCDCRAGFSGRFCQFADPCDFENGGCSHGCRRRDAGNRLGGVNPRGAMVGGGVNSGGGVTALDVITRCFCPSSLTLDDDAKTCVTPETRFENLLRGFGYAFATARLCFYENWEGLRVPSYGIWGAAAAAPGDYRGSNGGSIATIGGAGAARGSAAGSAGWRGGWTIVGGAITDRVCAPGRTTGRNNVLFDGAGDRFIITPEISLDPITGDSGEFIVISFALSVWGGLNCDPLEEDDEIVAELKFNAIPDMEWQATYRLTFATLKDTGYTSFSFSLPSSRVSRLLRINSLVRIRLRQLAHEGADADVWTLKEFVVGVVRRNTPT